MRTDPAWWTRDNDSSWEKVKAAFERDWEQTKHDFGGDSPDLKQDVPDTVKQAAGKQSIPPLFVANFEEVEPAFRFGYGAKRFYGKSHPEWNDGLATSLRKDWSSDDWDRYSEAVRRGYESKH